MEGLFQEAPPRVARSGDETYRRCVGGVVRAFFVHACSVRRALLTYLLLR